MHAERLSPAPPGPSTDPDLLALLRIEVATLRRRTGRRRLPAELHLGRPGGSRHSVVVDPADGALDAGARADLLGRLMEVGTTGAPAVLWLTRPGEPEPQDEDLAWLAAAHMAAGARGRPVPACYAVTPTGWVDVHSGEGRTWKRLRL